MIIKVCGMREPQNIREYLFSCYITEDCETYSRYFLYRSVFESSGQIGFYTSSEF